MLLFEATLHSNSPEFIVRRRTMIESKIKKKINNNFNVVAVQVIIAYRCAHNFPRSCKSSLECQRRMEITAINFAAMSFMHRRVCLHAV